MTTSLYSAIYAFWLTCQELFL